MTLNYLHRISSKYQVPQQVEITNVFAFLNVAYLQRGTKQFCRCKNP